jgi:hypothetical protein
VGVGGGEVRIDPADLSPIVDGRSGFGESGEKHEGGKGKSD